MSVKGSAAFAEVLVSQQYRQAVNAEFEVNPEGYLDLQKQTESIVMGAILDHREDPSRAIWEMRRQAAISEIGGISLGAFGTYLHQQGGLYPVEGASPDEIELASSEIIKTNRFIINLKAGHEDPIDYLDAALDILDSRTQGARREPTVGPGNYASALKFFTDKYLDFPSEHLDRTIIKEYIDRWSEGFLSVAKHDKPNFIEMTNIYFAIRHLPKGSFDADKSMPLLKLSLELLPEYSNDSQAGRTNQTLSVLMGALGNMDLSQTGESAATLIDLALRKGKKFHTTRDYIRTLIAIGNLPASNAVNACFASFLASRNNLEAALDIEGCDVATEQYLKIIEIVDDPLITHAIKKLASINVAQAARIYNDQKRNGDLTASRQQQLQKTVRRIGSNYSQI